MKALQREWAALLAMRAKHNASGQDGSDFDIWLKCKGVTNGHFQMELFA